MDNFDENRELSMYRVLELDKEASTWAASYAFKIGVLLNPDALLPDEFCQSFGTENNNVYPYISLKNESRTCKRWISLYRFNEDDLIYNIAYAENLNIFVMNTVSIWTYSYVSYLIAWKNIFLIKPSDFCAIIGKKIGQDAISMPFMDVKDELTCKEWIELYEFTDDLGNNYEKAKYLDEQEIYNGIQLPYFPRIYAYYLQGKELSEVRRKNVTPLEFCRTYVRADNSLKYNFLHV